MIETPTQVVGSSETERTDKLICYIEQQMTEDVSWLHFFIPPVMSGWRFLDPKQFHDC